MRIDKKYLNKLINNVYKYNNKFNGNELKYVLEYLDYENPENDANSWTARLEEAFAQKFGVKYAISHNSGTSTLHSCLHAAGVGAGDEVIGPIQTGIWFAFVCLHQNAVPVYVDSDPDTFNMDPDKIEENITERTKAIIPTHMHGTPMEMDKIMNLADKYDLIVIEDCAQSFLATIDGKLAGTIGQMASFSFETKKHMTTDQGGMVITDDENLAVKIRKHAGLGYQNLTAKQGMTSLMPSQFQNPDFKRHDSLAYNYRMPEICAAIGLAQLENLDEKVARRVKIAAMYDEVLKGIDWIVPQKVPENTKSAYWTYTIKYLGKEKMGVSWEDFYRKFNKNGGDGFFGGLSNQHDETVMVEKPFYGTYTPSDYPLFEGRFDYGSEQWPVAEDLQPIIMQLKTGYRDIKKAENAVNAFKKTIEDIVND
ncbi:MAG: DegT/DnrJ/EryC1/StrS family aminotransferase [Candidatus Marinimicrobia bacterium]|nr:DegT/DnrJ/EryC1/StrS family aminotransferase [Candidatus Neomarinimicrobiota bacterium]